MKRNLTRLSNNNYDLLVIGGGIYGSCIAWDAVLRGLSVALVEKSDFASATSANSLKIIHGGLRYLQHADIKRVRESTNEQRTLMRIAPHLIHPLPVLIPTYGHWKQGKEALSIAFTIKALIEFDLKKLSDPQKHIPHGHLISKKEVSRFLPGIDTRKLTGGAIFYDAQVCNSERLPLSFIRSSEKAGADVANYVEVIGFLNKNDFITGVKVKDVLSSETFEIRAKTVVNASGPWVDQILDLLKEKHPNRKSKLAKAFNLVTRPLFKTYAVGLSGKNQSNDVESDFREGNRFFFITPWRGRSLIGTSYSTYDGDPDNFKITEEDILNLLNEINSVYPSANLKLGDVLFVHGGLLPSSGISKKTGDVKIAKHYQIKDYHSKGLKGLISVTGVKYTTARYVAEKTVDYIFKSLGQKLPKSYSSTTAIYGGQIERFDSFLQNEINKRPHGLSEGDIKHLVYNYGSALTELLKYFDITDSGNKEVDNGNALIKAEVHHSIHEEMAQKLSDVIFRRTGLGSAGHPGDSALNICAKTMGTELGWNQEKIQAELEEVNLAFSFRN